MGEATFGEVVKCLRAIDAKTIVEFGSGASTVRLALDFPEAQIISVESNREWQETVLQLAAQHGIGSNLSVQYRPLRWQTLGLSAFLSYERPSLPARIDAVIVDGPPTWTRRGREACLYHVIDRIRLGGRVLLDDYGRNREKTMVRNWMWSFPGVFAIRTVSTGHGLCVMEKRREPRKVRPSLRTLPDHTIEALGVLFTNPLRRE